MLLTLLFLFAVSVINLYAQEEPPSGEMASGGQIIAVGTPEQIAANAASYTGVYIKEMLNRNRKRPPKKELTVRRK